MLENPGDDCGESYEPALLFGADNCSPSKVEMRHHLRGFCTTHKDRGLPLVFTIARIQSNLTFDSIPSLLPPQAGVSLNTPLDTVKWMLEDLMGRGELLDTGPILTRLSCHESRFPK